MRMLVRARVLTSASAAVAFLVASGALGFAGPAGAAVRSVSYLPKQAVAVGTGGAVASDDVEATSAGLKGLRGGYRRWRLPGLLQRAHASRLDHRRQGDGASAGDH